MTYDVVFDAAQTGYRYWSFSGNGLEFAAIGCGLLVAQLELPGLYERLPLRPNNATFKRLFPCLCTAIGLLFFGSTFRGTYGDYRRLATALHNGDYQVIEGVATGFVPMPPDGHGMESFEVGGHRYEYSDYVVAAGFNQTRSHGGPMRNGIRVRIADVGGAIARLEIARD